MFVLVRPAGFEPARISPADFLTTPAFAGKHLLVCGLDFLLAIAFAVGPRCKVSTLARPEGLLARDSHDQGFSDLAGFIFGVSVEALLLMR